MSGVYQNWLKVQNPNMSNDIIPMQSGEFQKPFYFGGSQIPNALEYTDLNITDSGLNGYTKVNFLPNKIKGKGLPTTDFKKSSNIHLPRYLKM